MRKRLLLLADGRWLFLGLLLLAGAAKAQEVACKAVIAGTRALIDARLVAVKDATSG